MTIDTLLAQWADSQRLTEADTALVRGAVLREESGPGRDPLGSAWWIDFNTGMSQLIMRVTAPSPPNPHIPGLAIAA